jgi:DUF4097 and DUF4098 domain-containing protein YvlB
MTAQAEAGTAPPRGRRAWLVLGSVAAVAGLGLGVLWTVSALGHETRTVARSFDAAKVRSLDVDAGDGDVVVLGDAETTSVDVRLRITEDVFGSDHSIRLRDDGRLDIRTGCHVFWSFHCGFRIEVHVPRNTVVQVRTDNGDVRVSGIDAPTGLATDNGDVRVEDVAGDLRLSTDNGDVVGIGVRSPTVTSETDNGDVSLAFGAPPRDVRAASDNGGLDLRLPAGDDAYAVHTETDNGSVVTPIRTDPTSDRRITATSDNGDIAIRYGR